MSTILEGLNKISGALGGAETATENLDALNAIAGALGGETTATNNADAIDQIAEHASGGGGSSDFSTATVTIRSSVTQQTSEEDTIGFNGIDTNEDEYEITVAIYNSNGNYYARYEWDITAEETEISVLMLGEAFLIETRHPMVASGNAKVSSLEEGQITYYTAEVTGDCTLTITD